MTRTKEELNKAIWQVLNSKFKKDNKEAFQAVEEAGYYVYKNGCGYWVVANEATHRYINLNEVGWKRYTRTAIQHGPYANLCRKLTDEETYCNTSKFDFVGCLEKPVNETWYNMKNAWMHSETLTAHGKFEDIQFSKRMVESTNREIDRIQNEIAKLQKRLVSEVESKVRYEQEVATKRAKYGLK